MSPAIPFLREMTFAYGEAADLSPLIRRVIARNPSPFTFHGTGTYIVGRGRVAIVDPGPALPEHVAAVMDAVRGETVSHILITHTHLDHSPAAAAVKAATGAPTLGFGPHPAAPGSEDVEEGGDRDFRPDTLLADGAVIAGAGWTLQAIHTPGHISNHLCFALPEERALFSGDHVMGWSTSIISPPDGNMRDYFASLHKVAARNDRIFYPTHGPPVPDPVPFVEAFIAHRHGRERQILDCIAGSARTIPEMVAIMYRDVPAYLHPAAARSVLAHLVHMTETGRIVADSAPLENAAYRRP